MLLDFKMEDNLTLATLSGAQERLPELLSAGESVSIRAENGSRFQLVARTRLHDSLIATTTLVEGSTLVSADPTFDAYGVNRLW